MAGIIRTLIEEIVKTRARGKRERIKSTREKIALQLGRPLASFTADSADDEIIIERLVTIGRNLGVDIGRLATQLQAEAGASRTTNARWAYSDETSPGGAAKELKRSVGSVAGGLFVFFASTAYQPEALAWAVKNEFPLTKVIGCSTAGELSPRGLTNDSVVGLYLPATYLEGVELAVVTELSRGAAGATKAVRYLAEQYGVEPLDLDPDKYVGLVLPDGLSGGEEALMVALGGATDALFIGGSAGDDLKFNKTWVFCEDKCYSDAAVLALLKLRVPYTIAKTQSFSMRDDRLLATKVDKAERTVFEFNDRPAVEAYAAALGLTPDKLDRDAMTSHPIGLAVGDEPYVRSPQQILDDGASIKFYCQVEEGSELRLLDNTDIPGRTEQAVNEAEEDLGRSIGAMLVFNCILRHLELESRGIVDEFVRSLGGRTYAGFSTYGEQYIGHINQTATILCFGKPLV